VFGRVDRIFRDVIGKNPNVKMGKEGEDRLEKREKKQ
jgi:hypothetical protein